MDCTSRHLRSQQRRSRRFEPRCSGPRCMKPKSGSGRMAGCDCSLGLMQWWSHNALCCSWQCCGLAKGQYSWDMTEACRVDVDRGVWISRLWPSAGRRLLHIFGSWVHYPAGISEGGGSVALHDLEGDRQVDARNASQPARIHHVLIATQHKTRRPPISITILFIHSYQIPFVEVCRGFGFWSCTSIR